MKMRVLSREMVQQLADVDKVMATVEGIYTSKAEGKTVVWPTVFHEWEPGIHDMDIKSGYIKGNEIHGLKCINFNSQNDAKGQPSLVGVIMVFDTETGMPLGLLDGAFITGLRTGCAGAIGAKYLARRNPEKLFCLGAGNQALFQLAAFVRTFPTLKRITVSDKLNPANGKKFAKEAKQRLMAELNVDSGDISFESANDDETMAKAVYDADIVVTVTPAHSPVIKKEWVKPGTHFSTIGADMSGKEEIDPGIFRGAVIFGDDLSHTVGSGEMEIPLKTGVITETDLKGEIGELILGRKPGRTDDSQITIYDACGMALLDIATAKACLELAEARNIGQMVEI